MGLMLQAFRDNLARTGLIPPGSQVLVGYSGGADSTCLIHLLRESGINFIAAHLHHGQRPEADKELALCEAFCKELDIPFLSGHADIPRIAADMKIGYEEAGRHARYAFFTRASLQTQCDLIATAHTRTDHVETVLLNMTRGSGLAGLAGIPTRRGNIIRPLLPFSRSETRTYCEAHNFWYHDDPANEDVSFSRARIRHRVVPELRAINPGADENISRLAEIADEEHSFLNGMAAAALEQSEVQPNADLHFLTLDCEAVFDRARLGQLPAVLFKRAVRLATEALDASLTQDQTEAVLDGVISQERGAVTAEGGRVVVEWDSEKVSVRQLQATTPFRYGLTVPGETASDEFGWRFVAFETKPDWEPQRASMRVQVAIGKIQGQLYFRTAKEGDKMQPLGFSGHRKVSDLLSEAGLSSAAKARIPIVCDMLGPIWVPGICLHDRVRLGEGESNALELRFESLETAT